MSSSSVSFYDFIFVIKIFVLLSLNNVYDKYTVDVFHFAFSYLNILLMRE